MVQPRNRQMAANMLSENCTKDNFPLRLSDIEIVIREAPENPDFLLRFLPKLDWWALVDTVNSVRLSRLHGFRGVKAAAEDLLEISDPRD